MSVPAWFDSKAYFANKLAQVQGNEPDSNWTAESFADALLAAGIDPTNPDDLYAHFVNFGNSEGISPNGYFDPTTYVINKAALAGSTSDAVQKALDDAGLSAWDHYNSFGTAEGVNPSDNFNTDAYLQAKVDFEIQKGNNISLQQLKDFLAQNNLSALEHYYNFGLQEGVAYTPGDYPQFPDIPGDEPEPGNPGQTFYLTAEQDMKSGTSGDDLFIATEFDGVNTLQTGDIIDGGDGDDMLLADVTAGSSFGGLLNTVTPTVKNVEKVVFNSRQSTDDYHGVNAVALVDAERIEGMNELWSSDSRANLAVEDVRSDSNAMTIGFQNADRGINYTVQFDNQHLKADAQTSSGVLDIELMDVRNNQETSGASPLLNNPFDKFTFNFTADDGTVVPITLDMSAYADKISGESATYDTLLEAFQSALADWEADHSAYAGKIVIAKGDTFTSSATVSGVTYTGTGSQITISSTGGTVTASEDGKDGTGWGVSSGTVPSLGGITWGVGSDAAADCPLIQTDIALDNVGRVEWNEVSTCIPSNEIFGSSAGDMVVGGMGAGRYVGVQRFDVTVDRGSWLSSLSSTNEALRYVTVTNADIDGDGMVGSSDTYNGVKSDQGNLFIGDGRRVDDITTLSNVQDHLMFAGRDGLLDDAVRLDGGNWVASGLVDVKNFDASTMTGKANISAAITDASSAKYLANTDTVDGLGNTFAPDGDFDYSFGSNDDTLNMAIDRNVAADNDFKMNIDMGDGNNTVSLSFDKFNNNQALNNNWLIAQHNLMNVTVTTGSGNDIINAAGSGNVIINAGAGNDIVYSDNTGAKAVFVLNAGSRGTQRAVEVNNGEIKPVNNDVLTNVWSSGPVTVGANSVDVTVTVTYRGVTGTYTLNLKANTNDQVSVSDMALNQAIIQAVNAEGGALSALLSAQEGAGHSLLLISKVDGQSPIGGDGLNISFSAVNAVDPTTHEATLEARLNTYITTNPDGSGGSNLNYATDGSNMLYQPITGGDSQAEADNIINLGDGNDVAVLGTNDHSNDTIVINNGHNGNNTIVNFKLGGAGADILDVSAVLGSNNGVTTTSTDYAGFTAPAVGTHTAIRRYVVFFENTAVEANHIDNAAELQTFLANKMQAYTSSLFMVYDADGSSYTMYLVKTDGAARPTVTVSEMSTITFANAEYWDATTGQYKSLVEADGTPDLKAFAEQAAALGNALTNTDLREAPVWSSETDSTDVFVNDENYADNLFRGEAFAFEDSTTTTLWGTADTIELVSPMGSSTALADFTGGSNGSADIQNIILTDTGTGNTVNMTAGANALYNYTAGDGGDQFNVGNSSGDSVTYDGVITGGANCDTVQIFANSSFTGTFNAGSDAVIVESGGIFDGTVNGSGADDTITVSGAAGAVIDQNAVLDGGAGNDTLTLSGFSGATTVSITNFETVSGSMLAAGDTLTFTGDSTLETVTMGQGALSLDATAASALKTVTLAAAGNGTDTIKIADATKDALTISGFEGGSSGDKLDVSAFFEGSLHVAAGGLSGLNMDGKEVGIVTDKDVLTAADFSSVSNLEANTEYLFIASSGAGTSHVYLVTTTDDTSPAVDTITTIATIDTLTNGITADNIA